MPDSDQPAETAPSQTVETTEVTSASETTTRTTRRAVARGMRLIATPAAIVIAWIVVVTQWNQSDTDLFNWATITAGIVLAVVTALWLLSLKFPALRRALLPFEGGLVVGAVILAGATTGYEVDLLGDRVAIAIAFGVIASLLLAFMQQLVVGRDRAWAWLAGVVVICAATGIAVPATLDWLDGSSASMPYAEEFVAGELVARATDGGFRLDDVTFVYSAPSLGAGYVDESAMAAAGGVYAEEAVPIDPATDSPVATATPGAVTGDPASDFSATAGPALPVDAASLAPIPTGVPASGRNDWAKLFARPDGAISLSVEPRIARGVTKSVQGSLRRGGCGAAPNAKELVGFSFAAGAGRAFERTLPIDIDDLRLDDELSLVVGTAKPLAPTRCVQLLTSSGIALAQLGAGTFVEDCLDPLDLPRGNEYMVRPSSFQDVTCAKRFTEYSRISSSLLVTKEGLDDYRGCRREREARMVVTERKLPHGARAFEYRDFMYGECIQFAANASTYQGFGMGVAIDPATMSPVLPSSGPAAPTTIDPAAVATATPIDPATGLLYPTGPSAAPEAPLAPGDPVDDLDGLTPEERAAKIR